MNLTYTRMPSEVWLEKDFFKNIAHEKEYDFIKNLEFIR